MNKYIFSGTVYPERVNFTLSGLSSRYKGLSVNSPDWGITGEFDFVVSNSKATITFISQSIYSHESDPNIETVKNFIEKISRVFVDTYCFVHSYNYDLIIDSVKCDETGLEFVFSVVGEIGYVGENEKFLEYLDIFLQKQPNSFGDALADYRRSIKYPDMTAAYCLRALESIRRVHFDDPSITNDNKNDKDGWNQMAKTIGITTFDSFDLMQQFAKPNRHGLYPKITWEQRKIIMMFTRDVIQKSIEWLGEN